MREAPAPGFSKVSEFFGVEVTGGIFSARKIKLFHIKSDRQEKELIGSDFFPVYQSRQGAYAVSDDGRTMIFVHDELLNAGNLNKTSGLYEFVHGRGGRLLDSGAHGGIYINETLPKNAIVFRRKNDPGTHYSDELIVVRSTDGKEYLWKPELRQPRPQAPSPRL